MGKKKRKTIPVTETIHFRPGRDLGEKIGQLAGELELSRGEAAKRLVSLALREMDMCFYGLADELVRLEYDAISFDDACHRLHVAIVQAETEEKKSGKKTELSKGDRLQIAERIVQGYRLMRGLESDAEEHHLRIVLVRYDEEG